jgi:carbonic anhydrase
VHAPQPSLPPAAALQHLRLGHARAVAALARGAAAPPPLERPAGAGRHVAAVVVCADAGVDVPALFGLLPQDVLLFSNPGASAGADVVAALERAAAEERLSLCVLLTHAGCRALDPGGDSPSARALARAAEPARQHAAARQVALERAQALVQRESLLAASPALRALAAEDRFRVVPASVDPRTGAIVWHGARAEELPLAPVR